MINDINKVIEEFEKAGYPHEVAVKMVESATHLSDEEFEKFKKFANEFNCTTPSIKPIKIVFQDDWKVETDDGYNITLSKRLNKTELENLIRSIGTSNISIVGEKVYYCPTCNRVLDMLDVDSCMNTPNEIIDYCLDCHSEVIELRRE